MPKIAIVGAGVSGGVVARGLRDDPAVELVIVEQVAPHDHLQAGNGLNIGPNALMALETTLPQMAASLREASLPWTRWYGTLVDGTPLFDIPLADVADRSGLRIRWSELYRIAREPLAGDVRYRRRCRSVETGRDGRLALVLDHDGGRPEIVPGIDLLIACDGRYSALREQRCGVPPPTHLGVANFRLLIEDGGAQPLDDMAEWYHGPSRLLAFRLADGRIYLSGNFPIPPGEDVAASQKTAAALRAAHMPAGGPVDPVCSFLVEAACAAAETLHWSRAQEIPTRFTDGSGRFLMLGDAAHAMVPTLGQGATQAIEDGATFVALYRELAPHDARGFANLIGRYEALRCERIDFVRQFSWDASAPLLSGADPVAAGVYKSGPDYRNKLMRLYGDLGAS